MRSAIIVYPMIYNCYIIFLHFRRCITDNIAGSSCSDSKTNLSRIDNGLDTDVSEHHGNDEDAAIISYVMDYGDMSDKQILRSLLCNRRQFIASSKNACNRFVKLALDHYAGTSKFIVDSIKVRHRHQSALSAVVNQFVKKIISEHFFKEKYTIVV